MTDNEIIKALEMCLKRLCHCNECPRFERGVDDCYITLYNDFLDLINRQKAEIERLKTANGLFEYICEAIHRYRDSTGKECLMDYCDAESRNKAIDKKVDELCKIQFARAEAVKEFAERLKATMEDFARLDFNGSTYFAVGLHHIDTLVKEFTEGKNDE